MTAPTADRERTPGQLAHDRRAREQQQQREQQAAAGPQHTYNLGAVRPFVKAAAQEIGDKFGITTIGGWRATAVDMMGHPAGLAIDVMCTGSTGDAVAAYALENASRLGVKYVIWKQRSREPNGEWEPMEDRGSPTANHMDHVHISFRLMGGSGPGADLIDEGNTPPGTPPMGDRIDSILPDWFGGVSDLALKLAGVAAAAALVIVGAKQAVTRES